MNLKSIIGSYLGHLGGYVVAAATIVSTLDPKLIPPQYSLLTAVCGLVTVVGHHGYAAGSAGTKAAVQAAVEAATSALKAPAVATVAVLLLAVNLTGCASLQSFLGSPSGEIVVAAGVEVAVTTAEQKGITAAQINRVAKAALAADQGASATVGSITTLINGQLVNAGIPSGDVAAFQILTTAFDAYVIAKYGSNPTVQQVQADVALFLGTVVADTGG